MPEQSETVVDTKVDEKVEDVDYQKELDEAIASAKKHEDARKGYELRHKKEEVSEVEEESDDEKEDRLADKVAAKLRPVIAQSLESNTFDKRLSELSNGNPALRDLLKLHFDNSTNPSKSTEDRLDDAYAIANRKVIAKTLSEINVAQKNRREVSGTGQGSSTEVHEQPGSNTVSANQLADLKKQAAMYGRQLGWSPERQKKFVDDAAKNLNRPMISR